MCPDATGMFLRLSCVPDRISEDHELAVLERFIVFMYRCTSHLRTVNEACLHLFTQGGKKIDNGSPNSGCSHETYSVSCILGQSYLGSDAHGTTGQNGGGKKMVVFGVLCGHVCLKPQKHAKS